MSPISRFVLWMLAFDFLGFAIGGVIAGGDPTVEPYVIGPVFVLAPAAAYLMVYQGGENRLRAALGLPAVSDESEKVGAIADGSVDMDGNPDAGDADPDPDSDDSDAASGSSDAASGSSDAASGSSDAAGGDSDAAGGDSDAAGGDSDPDRPN